MRLAWLGACCLSVSAWAGPSEEKLPEAIEVEAAALQSARSYRVDEGDELRIAVFGEESLTGTWLVGEGGALDFPLVGPLDVAGQTPQQIAAQLRARLDERYLVDPQVTVRVEQFGSKPVRVLGAVREPGIYHLTGPTTVLEIVARAGGIQADRAIREVRIRREGEPPLVVDVQALVAGADGDLPLQGGDVVWVPEGLVVYVSGQVEHPGEVSFSDGMTFSQAVAKAGGAKSTARLRRAWLLRSGERIRVNLRAVQQGREPDVPLKPGDQVILEESVF